MTKPGHIGVGNDKSWRQHDRRRSPGPSPVHIPHQRIARAAAVPTVHRKLNTGQCLRLADIRSVGSYVTRSILPDGRRTFTFEPRADRRYLAVAEGKGVGEDVDLGRRQEPADEVAQVIIADTGTGLGDRIPKESARS